jgi:hypothetical protein
MKPVYRRLLIQAACVGGLAACASTPPPPPVPPLTIYAVTAQMELLRVRADQPQQVLERRALSGLAAGERISGLDYRVSRGVLYALADSGRLYTVDTQQARLLPVVAAAPANWPVQGQVIDIDFNPTVDRVRVISSTGQSLRLHPETNAVVDSQPDQAGLQIDGALRYVAGDPQAGQAPNVAGVGYTYNKTNEKITTNYVIDRSAGTLAMMGSAEGAVPMVSPNTGQLKTVGSLGLTGALESAYLDISDVSNTPLLAARTVGSTSTRLYQLNLQSGRAQEIGVIGRGEALLGMAIEP